MSTTTAPTSTSTPGGGTLRRVRAMSRANTTLLMRNRLTLVYAVVLPLAPLVILGIAGSDTGAGLQALRSTALAALLFPIFYNLLSLFVTRRDELVLKRLRTGEARDSELLVSLAVPGVAVTILVMAAAVGIGVAVGLPVPTNPLLYVVTVLAGAAIFAGLALVTAAFTRTSEAAQITSMPVIVIAVFGALADVYPSWLADVAAYTPIAAVDTLLEVSWFARADGVDLSFGETFLESGQPLLVLVLWTVLALDVARRYLRWEPRT